MRRPTLPRIRGIAAVICALAAVTLGLGSPTARACRYNVRDLGFIDLEPAAYTLFLTLPTNTPPAARSALLDPAQSSLRDSNIRLETVAPADLPRHKLARQLEPLIPLTSPAALLVSPDHQTLVVSLPGLAGPDAPSRLTNTLDGLVNSPTRATLLREAARTFGAILFLPGTDAAANAAARRSITEAIAALRQGMAGLPKAVSAPPALVTLDPADLTRERVLLWSLGLETNAVAEPRLAVVYGGGRWIGPLMRGAEIAALNLTRLFDVIGADCECGMDLSWTRGTPLPCRWTPTLQQIATSSLGFDPDDPLVRIEASRILGRYGSAQTDPAAAAAGYREVPIDSLATNANPNADTNLSPPPLSTAPQGAVPTPTPPSAAAKSPPPAIPNRQAAHTGAMAQTASPWRPAIALLVGLIITVGLTSFWLIRRRRDS